MKNAMQKLHKMTCTLEHVNKGKLDQQFGTEHTDLAVRGWAIHDRQSGRFTE